jgi:hypothetical protein
MFDMSVTITAVSAAGPADVPTPVSSTEVPVVDFVAILQNTPMSGMPQLANPPALAGEIFNHLRGFIERANYYENLKVIPPRAADQGNVTLASADDGRLAQLLGASARDNSALSDPAPAGEGGATMSQPVEGNPVADLQRVMEFCLEMMNFSTESTLVGSGVAQGVHSVETLLRAQ